MAGPAGTAHPSALAEALRGLQVRLTEHFRGEERDGYGPAVLARAPHLDRKVRALLAEHGDLARALEAVIRKEEAARSADAGLRQALATWLGRMRRHESEENQLVEDAFNCEPCAGD